MVGLFYRFDHGIGPTPVYRLDLAKQFQAVSEASAGIL